MHRGRHTSLLTAVFLFFLASKAQGRQSSGGSGGAAGGGRLRGTTPPVGSGRETPLERTGEDDFNTWARHRLALAVVTLATLEPPIDSVDDVAIALVAQWAHETAKGRAEFNFNLGGWTARPGDDFHVANDAQTGSAFHWTSYPDLPTAVEDQIKRLEVGYPSAWAALLASPLSSDWIAELGRAGYFTADPNAYATAWAALDDEVRRLPR